MLYNGVAVSMDGRDIRVIGLLLRRPHGCKYLFLMHTIYFSRSTEIYVIFDLVHWASRAAEFDEHSLRIMLRLSPPHLDQPAEYQHTKFAILQIRRGSGKRKET